MNASVQSTPVICANPDCRIAETGKCVEGLEAAECPNYGRGQAPASNAGQEDETVSEPGVRLREADRLNLEEASAVLRSGDARVIAIVGPFNAGKTSLIASLYDLFQVGRVDGISFAGSQTLHAFERACHDARAASRRSAPHMERTRLGQVQFYHLKVFGSKGGGQLCLLFGDRAGEEYRAAVDDTANVQGFREVERADTLTLLVDGKRLVNAASRHNVIAEAQQMMQALIEGGAAQRGQQLAIVLTKFDLVLASTSKQRAQEDFRQLVNTLKLRCSSRFSAVQCFHIAASPTEESVLRGTGVAELLKFWLRSRVMQPDHHDSPSPGQRMFARVASVKELLS